MKKLFTLLFTFGSLTSVFAQYNNDNRTGHPDRNDNNPSYGSRNNDGNYSSPKGVEIKGRDNDRRDYAYDDHRYSDVYSRNNREKDFKISKINREYDYRISSVYADRYLRPREKNWQVQNLQKQRYDEIKIVEAYYRGDHSNRW